MQIFCVIPHTHASNYGFMTGSYLPLVERFFLDGLIRALRKPIHGISLSNGLQKSINLGFPGFPCFL